MLGGNKALEEIRWKNSISESNPMLKTMGHTTLNGEIRTVKGLFVAGVNSNWRSDTSGYNSDSFILEKSIA